MSGQRFVVCGAGGHAKVVIACIESAGGHVVGLLDDDPAMLGRLILGRPVIGPIRQDRMPPDVLPVIGIGSNAGRRAIAERWQGPFGRVVHPSAVVHASSELGEGTVVMAGVVVQPECRIGRHVILNTMASVDHDGVIGDFAHVAPGSHLSGQVTLGEGVLMGVGSAASPGANVGDWSTVGAGATVIGSLPTGVTAVGTPARILKGRQR